MNQLPWDQCVDAGVITDGEADTFRDCAQYLGPCHWAFTTTGLTDPQTQRLARAIQWMTSEGGVQ